MKKSNKNNSKKAKKSVSTGASPTNTTDLRTLVKLGGCSADYGRSLVNPFTGPSACVPTYPVSLTRKMRVFSRGNFSTSNTTGFGFVVCDPSFGIANNGDCAFASLATGVQANLDWNTAGNAAAVFSNSDYVAASVGTGNTQINFKIVSCGLKVRYIGTELDRGGQLIGLQDQDHRSLINRTLASVDGEETSRRFPVDRKWKRVLFRPLDDTDLDFQSAFPTYGPAAGDNSFFMGWCVQAPNPAVSLNFEFEYFANYEVIGRNVRGMTKSHVDPVGAAAVQAVVAVGSNLYPTDNNSGDLETKMMNDVAKYVQESTTTFHQIPASSLPRSLPMASMQAPRRATRDSDDGWDTAGDIAKSLGTGIGIGILNWLF